MYTRDLSAGIDIVCVLGARTATTTCVRVLRFYLKAVATKNNLVLYREVKKVSRVKSGKAWLSCVAFEIYAPYVK